MKSVNEILMSAIYRRTRRSNRSELVEREGLERKDYTRLFMRLRQIEGLSSSVRAELLFDMCDHYGISVEAIYREYLKERGSPKKLWWERKEKK